MRQRTLLLIASLLIVTVTPSRGFALWGRFPNDEPVKADNWPGPIVKAINSCRRVYGAGSWDMGWTFCFVGNTDDANRFLAQVAKEKAAVLNVVLVPEAGTGTADGMREPMGKEPKIDYVWSLHLYPYRDQIWIGRKTGETDEQLQKRQEQERARQPEFGATITIHCVGPIDQNTLKLPLRFSASVGGRLANLAEFHNQRREMFQKQDKARGDQEPTDMQAAEAPRASFGGGMPSTQPATKGE